MAATVPLLVADFFGLVASLSLLSSAFRRRCWQCVVVVGGSVPYLGWFFRLRRLFFKVVLIGVSSSLLFRRCRQRRTFLWLRPSASAPRRRCRRFWVSYCQRRLVVVVIFGLSLSALSLLGILLSAASLCCRPRRLLVVGCVVLSLSLAAASRRFLKILVYIRFTMHETTIEPQHQEQNGTAAL